MKRVVLTLVGLTSAMSFLGLVYGTDVFGLFNLTARLSGTVNMGITAMYLFAISQVAYWYLRRTESSTILDLE